MHLLRCLYIFSLLLWSVSVSDSETLNHSQSCGTISLWYFVFFLCCWFQTADILFWIIASVVMSAIALVSLKSRTASYFTSKMSLFRNSSELRFGTSNLRQNPRQVQ